MSSMRATTILIIDDSPEDRHTYKSFLQTHNDRLYTFLEADDAEEGLRICRQAYLDCIILDFELPDLSGIEFLTRLVQGVPEGRPPVIMITGRGSETVAVAALKAGASDYLVKSDISAQSLFRATHNALEVNQLNRSLLQEMRDREDAEADLRESESRYRLLVESVRDYAIMMLDTDGKITSWNAGARKMFGFHDDEVMGQHVRRLYPAGKDKTQSVDGELLNASSKGSHTADGYLVRKDGKAFWSTGSISPVHDRSGQLCGYSKVVRESNQQHGLDGVIQSADAQLAARLRDEALQPLKQLRGRIDADLASPQNSSELWRGAVDEVIAKVEQLCR